MTWIREKYKGQMLLLLTVIVAPVAIYMFAIGDTVQLWVQIRADSEKKALLMAQNGTGNRTGPTAVDPVSSLPSGRQNVSLSSFLFEVATDNNCVLESYSPYQNNPEKDRPAIPVSTAEVIITGKFIPLVKIIYAVEKFSRKWKIISTDIKASKPGRTNTGTQIKLSIIIQYIQV